MFCLCCGNELYIKSDTIQVSLKVQVRKCARCGDQVVREDVVYLSSPLLEGNKGWDVFARMVDYYGN